ncbi:unnamed protein product, partial [Laminaria digitata]
GGGGCCGGDVGTVGEDGGRPSAGVAPRGCNLATELTLPQAHPLEATPTPPTSPSSPRHETSVAAGEDRLVDQDCCRRGDCCRPRQATATPASVLPPYDGKPATNGSGGAGGDPSTVTDMDTASCGRMCTLWPLEAAKQAAEERAGA